VNRKEGGRRAHPVNRNRDGDTGDMR
jgi:hypothetical protein